MGISDLPDIDEDDWRDYQADQFTASTRPTADALAFEGFAAQSYAPIARAEQQYAQQPPPMDGLDGVASMQGPPSRPIMDGLSLRPMAYDGTDVSAPGADLFGADGVSPNPASQMGADLDRFAQQQRDSGFSRTPILGPIVTGGAEGLAKMAHGLGGSAEAFRQGDYGMAAGGAIQALGSYGDPLRGMAAEAGLPEKVPEYLLPPAMQPGARNVTPDTPVFGGLMNPRELAGLVPEALGPDPIASALIKGAGVASKLLPPVARQVDRIGGAVADVLGAGRQVDEAPLYAARPVGAPGRPLTDDVFYSRLGQSLDKLPARGSAEQMRKTLLAQGVKDEEMEWVGVNNILTDAQTRGIPVEREHLRTVFDSNQVQVREVVRGQGRLEGAGTEEEIRAVSDRLDTEASRLVDLHTEQRAINERGYPTDPVELQEVEARVSALDAEIAAQQQVVDDLTDEFDRVQGIEPGSWGAGPSPDEATMPRFPWHGVPDPSDPSYREFEFTVPPNPNSNIPLVKEGTHWPEPNVVAHARTIDRDLGNGQKALVILEAQSDIHQRGRRLGYQEPVSETEYAALSAEARALAEAGDEAGLEAWGKNDAYRQAIARDRRTEALQRRVEQSGFVDTPESLALRKELADSVKQADAAWETTRVMTKRLPFSKNWEELVMKRMLRQAAEDGYDYLMWSDAAFQGDVNNMGKRLLQVVYSPETRQLNVLGDDGQEGLWRNVFPENMSDYIGRPLTKELLSRPLTSGQSLHYANVLPGPVQSLGPGDRLDLLGDATEQYRTFYDQKLQQIADKLSKPYGGKTSINRPQLHFPDATTQGPLARDISINPHYIEITPEMREGFQTQGFPLFAKPDGGLPGRLLESPGFARNVISRGVAGGAYGGATGGVAGAAYGAATGEEDDSGVERAARVLEWAARGAVAGGALGAAGGSAGTVAGMQALASLTARGKFPVELFTTHPDTVFRTRTVLLAMAQDALAKGDSTIEPSPLVRGLTKLTNEMQIPRSQRQSIIDTGAPLDEDWFIPDDIQEVMDNIRVFSPQEIIDRLSPQMPPDTLKRTVQTMLADYFSTINFSGQRAGEGRADIAAARFGGAGRALRA